ncbi:hypothetical protein DSCO28_24280 [Desulfosarcina ovata subsp. sediminis]|uniref:Uroporphyrinogen decarboxylase (URO-D) domain-containing protein n=1 Tax=Desulfosarcina ovata subsp. sediminis TaxID=885957 RepID=A0A5K7ZIB4_9BACT|nr:uroporphyrinogen decarboxylase family protein [Desulfosarcina ovata]BBO81862.1 hypothetical protein DSCO28_24280 [Desulfosarcina ovata subsp. sediminis]
MCDDTGTPKSEEQRLKVFADIMAKAVYRDDQYVAVFFSSGTFEMTHYLMGMEDAVMGLYEEPECMHELIECLTDYEIRYAGQIIERLKPNASLNRIKLPTVTLDNWVVSLNTDFRVTAAP